MPAEVRAGDYVIWLHLSADDYKSPQSLGATSGTTVINVDDVDSHYQRCSAAGAFVIEPPTDQPYGAREWVPATRRASCGSSTRRLFSYQAVEPSDQQVGQHVRVLQVWQVAGVEQFVAFRVVGGLKQQLGLAFGRGVPG